MSRFAWFHRFGSPKWFLSKSGWWVYFAVVLAATLLATGVGWGLFFAPPDYQQGDAFRIIYIHVPAAMLAQSVYIFMAVAYLVGWVWKMNLAYIAAKSAIAFGMCMTALALITGSLWGKPIWGTYWIWDARLTSMLILFLLYLGIFALQSAFHSERQTNHISAMVAVIGLINIPIIKYSVEWWYTLHQPATFRLTEKPTMPASMWLPLLLTVLGYYSLFAYIVLVRMRTLLLHKQVRDAVAQQTISKPV